MNKIVCPKEIITYGYICEGKPNPTIFFPTFKQAVSSAQNDQPTNRPYYIVERTEHFEICGEIK